MSIAIKISQKNYEKLCQISGKLQAELKKPISLNEAMTYVLEKKSLHEFAGAWQSMDDKDFDEWMNERETRWKT